MAPWREYSSIKGLLINITGGNDLTLFEVDQTVNKIRAEVDPEAELIFGAIKDENMTGKIRVSIVATSLDGHKTDNKTVLNMVSRIQNRNTGYSENLFSHNPRIDNNTLNSIDGATALKLDQNFELEEQEQNNSINEHEDMLDLDNESFTRNTNEADQVSNNFSSGVSIESASYIENNNLIENEEEYSPKLFADEKNNASNETPLSINETENNNSDQLFDQDVSEDEDFEIPAFLRKQKF